VSTASTDDIIVLHIDDDTSQLDFTKIFISKSDPKISVDTVSSHNELLARDLTKYDCIISDYAMPKMNGIELAQKIRETSDIPIILYTGQGSEEVAELAFSVGIDDYLRKEFDPSHYQVLTKRVRNAVEKDRALKAFIKSRDLLNQFLESALSSIHIFDSDLRLVRTNEQAGRHLGVTDDHFGKHILEIGSGEERFDRFKKYQQVLETGETYTDEITLTLFSGKKLHLSLTAFKVGDGMGLILIDINQRKKFEENLRKSEKKYHDYINNAPDDILVVNYDGKYIEINKAVTKITGFSEDEVIGKNVGEVFALSGDLHPIKLFNQVNDNGGAIGDLTFKHKNGAIRWLRARA